MSAARSRRLAAQMVPKEELAREVERVIRRRGLSQAAAARLVNDAPSQVCVLLSGNLAGFSSERLIRWLALLGTNVDIVVTPNANGEPGAVRVRRRV